MRSLFDTRRHLTDFDSTRTGNILTDVLVIGCGVAGARAAIEAARYGQVTLLTKKSFVESATQWAQGGIAAAMAPEDSPELHFDDTVQVGCGLGNHKAIEFLVTDAPKRIKELIDWGLGPDRDQGKLALTREGGHSLSRIIHAQGDRTGEALVRTLETRAANSENIRVFEDCFVIDLITLEGTCVGVITYHDKYGHQLVWAKQTILATGGCGQLWRETTNPAVSTGDGLAAAFRAGATLRDMEMMQFHPTTLYVAGAGRALISEAVRGEGGHLVDRNGNRFMKDYHPDGELAPRDIVSRAVHNHLLETQTSHVYLDVRHIKGFQTRFPQVAELCADFEIDVTRDLIPVRPSAHYLIGGVEVTFEGLSKVEGLFCCGEAASTGVHGANRMASNSLMEGLVFGKLAGETAGKRAAEMPNTPTIRHLTNRIPPSGRTPLDLTDIRNSLRSVMWRNTGIVRHKDRLIETCDILDFWAHYTLDKIFNETSGWEVQNMLTVARVVAMSALERTESIGVHYRSDAEDKPADPTYHVVITRSNKGTTTSRREVQRA
ncbi:MAG: L-aspartate oxidase [Phycisphaerales bacterium]|nr:MAG: L-aspartate oxidase [Phycisphaerales bacterium]